MVEFVISRPVFRVLKIRQVPRQHRFQDMPVGRFVEIDTGHPGMPRPDGCAPGGYVGSIDDRRIKMPGFKGGLFSGFDF
jgi:hypothetical protein